VYKTYGLVSLPNEDQVKFNLNALPAGKKINEYLALSGGDNSPNVTNAGSASPPMVAAPKIGVGGANYGCTANQPCPPIASLNSFLVNGQTIGTVYGIKQKPVTVRFYGWADTNHMPIKRVRVIWGDNEPDGGASIGRFKNHKPYCSTSEKPAKFCVKGGGSNLVKNLPDTSKFVNITCRTDADCKPLEVLSPGTTGFYSCEPDMVCSDSIVKPGDLISCKTNQDCQGITTGVNPTPTNYGVCTENPYLEWVFGNTNTDATEACEEKAFEYSHAYSYKDDCKTNLTVDDSVRATYGLDEKVFKDGDKICVFKPRVQLLDNWGWCNGVTSVTDATAKGWHNDEPEDPVAGANVCNSSANALNATPFAGYVVVKN